MTGPLGVHVVMRTTPVTVKPPTVGRTAVTITGTTTPSAPHARVQLSADYFSVLGRPPSVHYRLGTVLTDARGRFALRGWRPRHVGTYRVIAAVPDPGHGLLPDTGCQAPVIVGHQG
jgi:hypothetical protein